MALSPSAPTSPLPRQLLRYVSSQLVAALIDRPAPTISLPSAARGVDVAAASQRASRAAPSPKGCPGAPRPGSGGHVHAAGPVMATTTSGVVMSIRGLPTPPALPAQGSSGRTHHVAPATATTTAGVVMGGPTAASGVPAQVTGDGENVDAAALAAASLMAVRRPKPPGPPREGPGGGGGIIHAAVAAADS